MLVSAKKASELVINEGYDWQTAFFDFVDSLRHTSNKQELLQDQPVDMQDPKLNALIRSMTLYLCDEANLIPPPWAEENHWLDSPWFVCGKARLYSFSLVGSDVRFKQNNIFVLSNFMDRV